MLYFQTEAAGQLIVWLSFCQSFWALKCFHALPVEGGIARLFCVYSSWM